MNLSSFDDQFRTTDITSHHLDMMFSLPIYIDANMKLCIHIGPQKKTKIYAMKQHKKKQLNIEDILFTCDLVSRNNLDPLIVLNNRNISHLINYITQDD
ncbi:Man(7)GlcNAc(2)-PP-Dol alpha-1 6-mannosyltransferase precursor [Sarcoptes scabiei]|nr:Man(7)GlcNAc(2)-PP-Dol alpha-1 6-mannosyltransferase precursor [Sarcoptes scabiei]